MTRQPDECTCAACPIHANPLATAHRAAGWSQKEAAQFVSCHPNHLADIEYGRKAPSTLLLSKLRTAYAPHLDSFVMVTRPQGRPKK